MTGIFQLSTRLRQLSSKCQVPSNWSHPCYFLVTTHLPVWSAQVWENHDVQRGRMDMQIWISLNQMKGEAVDVLQLLLITWEDTNSCQEPSHFPDECWFHNCLHVFRARSPTWKNHPHLLLLVWFKMTLRTVSVKDSHSFSVCKLALWVWTVG